MSPDTEAETDIRFQWMRVREAITERWPHINRDELSECPDDTCKLTDFVRSRVETSDEEIQSVVKEFAPHESIVDRVSHAASHGIHNANQSAQFAYMRVDEAIAKRPTESVLTGFVAGIALGAVVTALWFRSQSDPSTWDRVKSRTWS